MRRFRQPSQQSRDQRRLGGHGVRVDVIVSEWLGFETPFMLRLRVAPGETPDVMRRIDRLPQTRLVAHVASDMSVLATGLVTDRSALALFVDNELAGIPGVLAVSVDVMLAEPRRYWLDRDLDSGLGEFHAPTLP